MARILILRGLPASGKSTKAQEYLDADSNCSRVNKDDLRHMFFGIYKDGHKNKWSGRKEDIVIKAETALVKLLIDKHRDVVIDDTNLNNSHIERWKQIALETGSKIEIIDIDTPMDECIKRDAAREHPVGEQVIRAMAAQYGLDGEPEIIIPPDGKILIVDIDGTLSNCDHRLHFIQDGNKDWNAFFDAMSEDTLNESVHQLMTLTYPKCHKVIMSGRPTSYRHKTKEWLKKYNVDYVALIMRNMNDKRPDWVVKGELFDKYFPDKNRIEMIIDDRVSVIEQAWRSRGLPVIDVGKKDNPFY